MIFLRTKSSIAINNVYLHDVDSRIIVQSITESEARLNPRAVTLASRTGQRLTGLERQTMDVTVHFSVLGRRDMIGRAQVIERVAAWAASGSILTVDYRPNRQLHVVCVQYPSIGNIKEWDGAETIIFRAYEQPYWEDVLPMRYARQGSGAVCVINPGTMAAPLEFEAVNNGEETVEALAVMMGDQLLGFDGLDLAPGDTVRVWYQDGVMHAGAGGASVYGKRTTASVDDLMLAPGANDVYVTSDGACDWRITVRGRYL